MEPYTQRSENPDFVAALATPSSAAPNALRVGGPRDVVLETRPKGDTSATVAIASISDQDWYISRTHGVYHIPACPQTAPPGHPWSAKGIERLSENVEPYALLLITSRGDVIDLGDGRRFPFTISAREIADDLLQNLHDHGVFVCAGPRPSSEELAAASARREAYYLRLIGEGDTLWARGHSFREISDLHRRAALAMGAEREWAYVPARMAECPACGEKVKVGVAICKHCRAILDAEKAARHGLIQEQRPAPVAAAVPEPSAEREFSGGSESKDSAGKPGGPLTEHATTKGAKSR